MEKIELLGGACFSHGPYTFYKAVRISNGRVLRLGSFFLTKLWSDADLVSIGELQLLWMDSRGPNQPLASLRLYFLPENTPDGRRDTHGEDEVLTISEKVVVRVHDLVTWLSPTLEWSWGREVSYPTTPTSSPETSPLRYEMPQPQVLTDPGIDFSDVEKQQKEYESNLNSLKRSDSFQTKVVVLSYPRYCRYRALLRRLEGAEPSWLCSSIAAALGGFTATPGTKVLFCRDTFDYPDLETHELLCNHLAPKLKGRPRRKRKKRSASPGESSNESEASVASTSKSTSAITSLVIPTVGRPPLSGIRRSERKTSAEEKQFITDVQSFMNSRGTPVGKMPLLGYRQIDLFLFYTKVQMLGGYDSVSAGRLWKTIYDDIGGNTGSTSAATITRRHYERLLLPYERYQRGEETKVRLNLGRRTKSMSASEDLDIKEESSEFYMSETPPPIDVIPATTTPPLQPIMSATTTTLLLSEKPKAETGKTSSLRSVRVKPERLKSLNTIIANNATPSSQQASQLPSPPPSSNTSISTPNSTPSTTPTNGTSNNQSVLERQLNSPLISQQVPPSCSPPGLPVTSVAANASTVVTLTPPPEKDMKEIKLDPKQTTLLAQGKENIPLFGSEKFAEKTIMPPISRSPEVIDLENENDMSRDKIIIPSFKKRKLEILREGGLEVTAVDLDVRPSVIQSCVGMSPQQHQQQQSPPSLPATMKSTEEKQPSISPYPLPVTPNSIPKLISVTVTPDIGHMLPSPHEHQNHPPRIPTIKQLPVHHNNNNISMMNNNNMANSRIINLGSSNNTALLQLYANANVVPSTISSVQQSSHRFVPPNIPNGRLLPPKVTQSRSIFVHNERMVYGNPKDILNSPPKYHSPHAHQQQQQQRSQQHPQMNSNNDVGQGGSVLDLTQKTEKPTFPRPSLEIVRVPVVQRPNPLNLDVRNSPVAKDKLSDRPVVDCPKRIPFPAYQNVIDSRTIASNNLEITLVNPKHKNNHHVIPSHVQIPSPPNKNAIGTISSVQMKQQQSQQQVNGKYTVRNEPISPYTPRKQSHPIIPNVPNLNHLNHSGSSFPRVQATTLQPQQQMSIDRRKAAAEAGRDHQHRRISEGEKSSLAAQQQQHHHQQEPRQNEAGRRHSLPSIPSGFVPTVPQNNSTPFPLSQLPNASGKFLPILDPMYYSTFYNGLFPPPIPPTATAAAAAASSFLPPEFNAYYKELLASSQPRLTGMTGQPPHQQPAAPTSK
ncbi:PREDICTED: AT-rich interactive domain-containing protein 5B-like isoform X1 [Trachymyrmex cornetzi]|uniref:AT-rich interactive domain-containing protein 5B-like isoform X1 n=1 Tax=Trachymyrmex cornetzi TaxID=471704 RepID=UPI00084F3A8E|nr:PREDICTED: AT-rich interactive domain-containing protein 5B-like isoform X1 [Trachymyrmex cornetzi]